MRERYHRHGWNLADDDVPRVPECDPLASPQHRRWLKSLQCSGSHQALDGINVDENPGAAAN